WSHRALRPGDGADEEVVLQGRTRDGGRDEVNEMARVLESGDGAQTLPANGPGVGQAAGDAPQQGAGDGALPTAAHHHLAPGRPQPYRELEAEQRRERDRDPRRA